MQRHHTVRTLAFALACGGTLLAPTSPAAVFTVGPPGATTGCTHATIQAAIDAAAATPGLDIIRIARGTYPAQHLFVNDTGNLAIEGGFLECSTLVQVDFSILDGQGANPAGPIIDHRGAGNLALADLYIQNGNATAAGSTLTLGGGVSSSGAGALTIRRSVLANNRAYLGGGLYLGTPAAPKVVTLTDVTFGNNAASKSGGGIYAQLSQLTIDGDGESYFGGNHADGTDVTEGGGAIYATASNLTLDARLPTAYPFMDNNWTHGSGGAIYFAATRGASDLLMTPRRGGGALTFARNAADVLGGAINVEATAVGAGVEAKLVDAVVSDNRAPYGSAIYLYTTGDTSTRVEFEMVGNQICPASWRCNRIDGNVSSGRASVDLEQAGNTRLSFAMRRGHIVDNVALSGGSTIHAWGGRVLIDNSVVAGNDAGNAAVIFGGDTLTVQNSTVADNIRVTPAVFSSSGQAFNVHNSIVFQPDVTLLQAGTGTEPSLRNLMLSSTRPVGNEAPRNIQYTQDPLFVDSAQRDYRIQPGSQARNRWSPGSGVNVPTVDLLGATRPAPGDTVTPYDFGAYEYGAVIDSIFADDFDGVDAARAPGD